MGSMAIDAQIRSEIEALVHEHAWLLDNRGGEKLADLYIADGRLYGLGPEKKGKAAIAAYGMARTTIEGRTARHVCTNLRLSPVDGGRIAGHHLITLYRHDGDGLGPADACALADAHDIFAQDTDGHWKIAERRLDLVFESASHQNAAEGAAAEPKEQHQ